MVAKQKRRIGLSYAALLLTYAAWAMLNVELYHQFSSELAAVGAPWPAPAALILRLIELLTYTLIVNFLLYGSAVFILTRIGYLRRLHACRPESIEAVNRLYDRPAPPALTILVPSYKEEPDVVRRTLLSAALLEYPRRRLVLLIDNPPKPKTTADRQLLADTRALPEEISALLRPQDRFLKAAARAYGVRRRQLKQLDYAAELRALATLYQRVAAWYEEQAEGALAQAQDHTARFFVEQILRRPAHLYRRHARHLLSLEGQGGESNLRPRLDREYRRLATLFEVEISSFERKQYGNLSHAANKAMNLNSYIGLIGRDWKPFHFGDEVLLQQVPRGTGEITIPTADYIITLDADSLLMQGYALRLINIMEKPAYARVAIAQTPYNAFRGAPQLLEHIAGAQTDMQYVVHQGFTRHEATFWVGANALLRAKALDDIVVYEEERGHQVPKYIQDRTVIEDTESSIDLVTTGWRLFNYPARLAYSATPPDFGSLLIQRRRWANGGLIIFPKLVRELLRGPRPLARLPEFYLRSHYLISTAFTNLGLLIVILYGFHSVMLSPWLVLSVLVYFAVYAVSLKEAGYRWRDFYRVWALNLLLIPVNLAGAFTSIVQLISGKQVPFGRTPKVEQRTASPAWLVLFQIGLMSYCLMSAVFDLLAGEGLDAGFAALNGVILLYGITVFMGWKNVAADLRLALPRRPLFARPQRQVANSQRQ